LYSTSQVFEHQSPLLQRVLKTAKWHRVEFVRWHGNDQFVDKGWKITAIHPYDGQFKGTDNANSLCVVVEFAGRKILLPGDLEPPGTQSVISMPSVDVDVLMAPHHGSIHSKSDKLLQWCTPETVVISGGTRSLSKKVLQQFADEHRRVLATARDHALRIEISSDSSIRMMHWMEDDWQDFETSR
jgi:competence protein ComEC